MKPKQSKEATERQMKPKHNHHLTLYENNNNGELRIVCHKCGQHLDESYNCICGSPVVCYLCKEQLCDECDFDLHLECVSLKAAIEYQGHQHPLILVQNMSYSFPCEACGCEMQGAFLLRCVECGLYFHVQCGSPPPPTSTEVQDNEREKIKHSSHKHLLFLIENKRNDKIICVACEKNIQANHPAYGCHHCEFYLHKSCVELPREIQHPFHRHPLSLPSPYPEKYQECDACHKHYYAFSYSCQDCDFNLDLDCSLRLPSIKLRSHKHVLTLFKKLYDTADCDSRSGCVIGQNKSTPLDDCYLRCVACNFNLHLLCCRLPKSFKHDCHQHPLTLKDNFIHLFVDDFEDEEYCCDFCEARRNARECVYHCEKCDFVVDLDCVFSEIIQFLEG
ncbi:hypothetical protein AB3S75_000248 [Citrus x aurantiifolia]